MPPSPRFSLLVGLKVLAIVFAGWWVYSPALHGGWIWDDHLEIVHNPALRSPAWWQPWVLPVASDYLPLTTTLQWLEWHVWHDSVAGYHCANLALHLLNALLVWRLLAVLELRAAWFGGLLFAIHPVAVESVAWIAEQKNTLSLALALGSTCAWLRFDAVRARRTYAWALLLFLAALLAKPSVVMLPGVFLLHAWWRHGRLAARDLRLTAPFFAAALIVGLLTLHFQTARAIGAEPVALGGAFARLGRAGLLAAFYLRQSLWPIHLVAVYPDIEYGFAAVLPVLAAAALAALGLWRWRPVTWGRGLLFGLGAFALALLPVLGFLPMAYQRIAWAADHFAYVALVPLAALAAAALALVLSATPARWRGWATLLAAALPALLAVQARSLAYRFESEETLWTQTLARNPDAWIAHNNLGQILAARGQTADAAAHFSRAVQLRPASSDAHYNLANTLLTMGQIQPAIAEYEWALRLKPDAPEIHDNLANALVQAGNPSTALAHYDESIRLAPTFAIPRVDRARTLKNAGRLPEALADLRLARTLDPASAPIARDLANVLADLGQTALAITTYQDALTLQPSDPETHNNLGALLAESGRLPEALREFEAAVRLNPNLTAARENLAMLRQQLRESPPR